MDKPLEDQGPFAVILHKFTEIIARNDEQVCLHQNYVSSILLTTLFYFQAIQIIDRIEQYIKDHPKVIIIDPLDSVRTLLDRYKTYNVVLNTSLNNIGTPTYNYYCN